MATDFVSQVGADRLVSHALRVFDMSNDPERAERERASLQRRVKVYGAETLSDAIGRCQELLDVNPQDELASQALALLVAVRDGIH